MAWFHVKESFRHLQKEEPLDPRKISSIAIKMNVLITQLDDINYKFKQLVRLITYEWLLNSLLDVWRLSIDDKIPYWQQAAPSQMRQLYREILSDYGHSSIQSTDRLKVLVTPLEL